MECLRVLEPELRTQAIGRDLINGLWGICHLARAWGVHPDGMLRRNQLIAPEDVQRLEAWIDQISWTVFWLLDGADSETAFEAYEPGKNAHETTGRPGGASGSR